MKTFVEFLEEGNKKYYPYKLGPRRPGQKRRSIVGSNSYFVSQKKLSKKIAATKKTLRLRYRKKKTTKR